jgi:hypothetical protein
VEQTRVYGESYKFGCPLVTHLTGKNHESVADMLYVLLRQIGIIIKTQTCNFEPMVA